MKRRKKTSTNRLNDQQREIGQNMWMCTAEGGKRKRAKCTKLV